MPFKSGAADLPKRMKTHHIDADPCGNREQRRAAKKLGIARSPGVTDNRVVSIDPRAGNPRDARYAESAGIGGSNE